MSVDAQMEKLNVAEDNGADASVLESSDFSVIHPLTYKWTFWYMKPPVGSDVDWMDLMKKLTTVDSVEHFWGAFNSLPKITELPVRADFAFFRDNIRPMWEDEKNSEGGKWVAQLPLQDDVDHKWLNLLLSLIGGTLDENNVVNGVFAMVRPRNTVRVQMWVSGDANSSIEAAKKFKEVLNLGSQQIEYFHLNDSRPKNGLQVKIAL